MRIAIEIAAAILGIMLATWSGPAIHDIIDPSVKFICPYCGESK